MDRPAIRDWRKGLASSALWKRIASSAWWSTLLFVATLIALFAFMPETVRERTDSVRIHLFGLTEWRGDNGLILLETPQVFTRGRLVNDRTQESDWLQERLSKTTDLLADHRFAMAEQRRTTTEMFERVSKPSAARNPTDQEMAERTKLMDFIMRPNPRDEFIDANLYRETIRHELMSTILDDAHDIDGNSIVRFNFNMTLMPEAGSDKVAMVTVKLTEFPPECDTVSAEKSGCDQVKTTYAEILQDWRLHIQTLANELLTSNMLSIAFGRELPPQQLDELYEWLLREFSKNIDPDDRALARRRLDALAEERLRVLRAAQAEEVTDSISAAYSAWEDQRKRLALRNRSPKKDQTTEESSLLFRIDAEFKRHQSVLNRKAKPVAKRSDDADSPESTLMARLLNSCIHRRESIPFSQMWQTGTQRSGSPAGQLLDEFEFQCPQVMASSQEAYLQLAAAMSRVKRRTGRAWISSEDLREELKEAVPLDLLRERSTVVAEWQASDLGLAQANIGQGQSFSEIEKFCTKNAPPWVQRRPLRLNDFFEFLVQGAGLAIRVRHAETQGTDSRAPANNLVFALRECLKQRAFSNTYAVVAADAPKRTLFETNRSFTLGQGDTKARADVQEIGVSAQSGILGFRDWSRGALKQAQETSRRGEARFGWAVLPISGHAESHIRTQQAQSRIVSAMVSLPGWWKTTYVQVRTCWISSWSLPVAAEGGLCVDGRNGTKPHQFELRLPSDGSDDLMQNLRFFVRKYPRLMPPDQRRGGRELKVIAGERAQLLVPGLRLWRSPIVMLGQQKADSVEVLPDMKGLIAKFTCVAPLPEMYQQGYAAVGSTPHGESEKSSVGSEQEGTTQVTKLGTTPRQSASTQGASATTLPMKGIRPSSSPNSGNEAAAADMSRRGFEAGPFTASLTVVTSEGRTEEAIPVEVISGWKACEEKKDGDTRKKKKDGHKSASASAADQAGINETSAQTENSKSD